jgi:hypothetical protein
LDRVGFLVDFSDDLYIRAGIVGVLFKGYLLRLLVIVGRGGVRLFPEPATA